MPQPNEADSLGIWFEMRPCSPGLKMAVPSARNIAPVKKTSKTLSTPAARASASGIPASDSAMAMQ